MSVDMQYPSNIIELIGVDTTHILCVIPHDEKVHGFPYVIRSTNVEARILLASVMFIYIGVICVGCVT